MEYKEYSLQTFNLSQIEGLSEKQITVHLGLYKGYVDHVNKLHTELARLSQDKEANTYAIMETRRRLGFEFNGMRLHEYYFTQLEDADNKDAELSPTLLAQFGSKEALQDAIKNIALTRGIGWTILYWDRALNTAHIAWVADHELGGLAGVDILLALDMWEHAFMVDYTPAEKGQYIDAFFANLNWNVIEERFQALQA